VFSPVNKTRITLTPGSASRSPLRSLCSSSKKMLNSTHIRSDEVRKLLIDYQVCCYHIDRQRKTRGVTHATSTL